MSKINVLTFTHVNIVEKTKSPLKQMFQKEDYYRREIKFQMDFFLGLDENDQEDF